MNTRRTSRDLLLAFSVCPLLAVSDTMSSAIGLGLAVIVILLLSRLATLITASVLDDDWQLAATLIIVTAIASGLLMLMQAQLPLLHDALDVYPLLVAVNAAVILHFVETDSSIGTSLVNTTKLGLQIAILLIMLGIARELVGRGSVFHDAGNQFGEWARSLQLFRADMGFLLAMLPPGAFISLGLLLAARNWFVSRRNEQRQDH